MPVHLNLKKCEPASVEALYRNCFASYVHCISARMSLLIYQKITYIHEMGMNAQLGQLYNAEKKSTHVNVILKNRTQPIETHNLNFIVRKMNTRTYF